MTMQWVLIIINYETDETYIDRSNNRSILYAAAKAAGAVAKQLQGHKPQKKAFQINEYSVYHDGYDNMSIILVDKKDEHKFLGTDISVGPN